MRKDPGGRGGATRRDGELERYQLCEIASITCAKRVDRVKVRCVSVPRSFLVHFSSALIPPAYSCGLIVLYSALVAYHARSLPFLALMSHHSTTSSARSPHISSDSKIKQKNASKSKVTNFAVSQPSDEDKDKDKPSHKSHSNPPKKTEANREKAQTATSNDAPASHSSSGNPPSPSPSSSLLAPANTNSSLTTLNLVISSVSSPTLTLPAPSPTIHAPIVTGHTSVSDSVYPSSSSIPAQPPVSNSESGAARLGQQPHGSIPTVAIVLLAIGSAMLLAAVYVVFKMCRKTRRPPMPRPSLPILQHDSWPDGPDEDPGSPLFGGKERLSSRPGSNQAPWTWTQYRSGIPKQATTGNQFLSPGGYGTRKPAPRRVDDPRISISSAHTATIQQASNASLAHPMMQQVQNNATSRLSAVSMSIYPTTPRMTARGLEDIGVAVSDPALQGITEATVEVEPVPKSKRRSSARRSTLDARAMARRSTLYGESEYFAYEGAEVMSPSLPAPVKSVAQGRAPVKASYGAGSYVRGSASTSNLKRVPPPVIADPFDDNLHAVPPVPLPESSEQRHRSTKALTMALGLVTPELPDPLSPGMTVYPEDSLSRRGTKKEKDMGLRMLDSPGLEATTSLGMLMLSSDDVASQAGVEHTRTNDSGMGAASSRSAARKRDTWKQPRVSTAPQLPTLAQMALAHANPTDYEDYRSPTYSIYGLYGPDRKSRMDGGGY